MHTLGILAAIVVTLNGSPVKDAEVCGFRAKSVETPFQQLLGSNEIVCNTEFQPGKWNVFARRGTDFVSSRTVLATGEDIELRLQPAAVVSFTQPNGFVYVTDTTSAFPADANGNALVPADRDLVPLLARDGAPLAVAATFRLAPGEKKSLTLDPGERAIATWVAGDNAVLRELRRKQPPVIKGAINPIRGTVVMNNAMQFIRGVAPGTASIELAGVPWKKQVATVTVPKSGVALTTAPMKLIPTSSIVVKWMVRNLPLKNGDMTAALNMMSCRSTRNLELLDTDQCKILGSEKLALDKRSGDVTFDDVKPGTYVVEVARKELPPLRESVRVDPFEQQVLPLDIEYTTLSGRVTVAGKPVSSRVRISFGFTTTVYSDDDGEYSAILAKPLAADRIVSVRSKDGSVDGEVIVDRDVLPNSRFDIDLPANRVTVEAVDSETSKPVEGAIVRYGAFRSGDMSSVYYFRLAFDPESRVLSRTDGEGRYVIRNLPPEKTLRVCLEHEAYERTCADPMKLTSSDEKTLRIVMEPRDRFSGQIAGVSDVAGGQLYWFSADGRETERTSVKPDGSFQYNLRHDPGEAVVFVSMNHPLFAFMQPQLAEDDAMTINEPAAPVTTFEISIGPDNPQTDAVATIVIGGLVVPYPPFAQHLALHGSQLDIRNKRPLIVPDILATAPISAILGPPLAEVTPQMRSIDLFRLPQYRGLPRKLVAGNQVAFAMRSIF